jgi:hypothetical protein
MKRRTPALRGEELAEEILKLSELDIDKLRERWKRFTGNHPPER